MKHLFAKKRNDVFGHGHCGASCYTTCGGTCLGGCGGTCSAWCRPCP